MLKLKLYLFLGKYIKYFRAMAENYLIKRIKNEILLHLKEYGSNDFEVIEQTYLKEGNKHIIKTDIKYPKKSILPYSFSYSFSLILEYNLDKDDIDKDIEFNDTTKKGRILIDYFNHFDNMNDINKSLILQYFQSLKNNK
ncbi:hypothetical protein [Flavobacterium lipolyticum]|uniref:Uncharacterized protein n=1 Tax=Flavobacterium lipolyticum TaxID=2893754 RepID=A0ABS8M3P2_9FLAO|nr:hypothetical protein [Flavobacterium sp. F-126]MCC9018947.1 hypothetical protein [Flavobacterium sp. F-126]